MDFSTSSIHPGVPGVKTECDSRRRLPEMVAVFIAALENARDGAEKLLRTARELAGLEAVMDHTEARASGGGEITPRL